MIGDVYIDEIPYNRMKFVDLLNESEEMKWKILEYHNQKFVMDKIAGPLFTKEGHIKFLAALPSMKRKHYIIYFDDRAIGKYSFDIEEDAITNTGTYLFHEEDVRTGLGLMLDAFFKKYVFKILGKNVIKFGVRKDNKKQLSFMKRLGAHIVREDEYEFYFELTKEDFLEREGKYDAMVSVLFS